MIYFEAIAGLCNRMRGIASAYQFAKSLGEPLTIIWRCNDEINCKLDDLFYLNTEFPVKIKYLEYVSLGIKAELRKRYNDLIVKAIKKKCQKVYEKDGLYLDINELAQEAKKKNIYMFSWGYWYESEKPFEIFELKETLEKRVNDTIKEFEKPCVGIHIRRTDHTVCIENSPTELFIEYMEKEPKDRKFYLATDDLNERRVMVERFGKDRVFFNDYDRICRNNKKGIEDAVVDLYVLSRMDKLIGSYRSSFSQTAAMINGIEYVEVKKN